MEACAYQEDAGVISWGRGHGETKTAHREKTIWERRKNS
jgi:hypothetical protein